MPSELKTKERKKSLEDQQDGSIKGDQDVEDLIGDPGVRLHQLCSGHVRFRLHGGEGGLGDVQGKL